MKTFALDTVDSTNAEAFRRYRRGEAAPYWLTAKRQTGGRGRRGRSWVSEEGNLYSSLLIEDPAPIENVGQLPLVVAVALSEAIGSCLDPIERSRLNVKWPNDILIDGRKMAGILIETESIAQRMIVVIGAGVNCATHPKSTISATNLQEVGIVLSTDDLFTCYRSAMADALETWNGGNGFRAIRDTWMARAAGIGETITIRLPKDVHVGLFQDLDEHGRLILKMSDGGTMAIASGDVFLGRETGGGHG